MDDKALNKSEPMQKEPLDTRKRDRGDNLKKREGIRNMANDGFPIKEAQESPLPDQGDVAVIDKLTKIPKTLNSVNKIDKTIDKGKKQYEMKPKLKADVSSNVNVGTEKLRLNKTSDITNNAVNKTKIEDSNVGDKVSLRPKGIVNQNQNNDINKSTVKSDLKTDRLKKQMNSKSTSRETMSVSSKPNSTRRFQADADRIKEKDTTLRRKPLIRTVKSKNNNRIYKAVTFTELKQTEPTVLKIDIPNTEIKKTKVYDEILETKPPIIPDAGNKLQIKLNLKAKSHYSHRIRPSERIKHKKVNRSTSSPEKFNKAESPPSEVAKWAPSCLNAHTKPYYEAWVNTTLTAITKMSEKDKLFFEKQNMIKMFQKSLERGPEPPDLELTDESYTGKIVIKQKKSKHRRMRQPHIAPLIDGNDESKI